MNQFQSLDEVFAALRRRAVLILALIAAGCALSLQVAMQQEKLYEATAVVQIEDAAIPEQMTGQTGSSGGEARRVRLIEQRLMARDNLIALMDEYGLFADEPALNERVFAMRQSITLEEIRGNAQPWQTDVVPSGLRISVRLDHPEKAAAVANDLMAAVIEEARARGRDRAQETFAFFDEEVARVTADIAETEEAIASFKRENAEALPAGATALRDQLNTYEQSLLDLEQEIIRLQSNSGRLRAEDLDRQVALLREQQALIRDRIAGIESTLDRAPDVERSLGALERELAQLQEQYTVITRRKAEAEMGQMLQDREQADRFEVLETAIVPETSISRSKRKIALAGGVASVIVALVAAFVLELVNPAIRTAAQLERQLGVTPVVAIPPVRSRRDRRRRLLLWLAGLAALIATLPVVKVLVEAGFLDRLLFRRSAT